MEMKGRKRSVAQSIHEIDFKKLAKTASHPRERMRYLAFAHIRDGKSNSEIALMLKIHRMTITDWIKKFNEEGINGLKEKEGRGAKQKLNISNHDAFRRAVLELQDKKQGGRIKGKDVLNLMEDKFGIKCTLKSVYNALHRVDLVWISGRSKHPKSDPEAQETFKKTLEK
jgi:transposase